MSMRVAPAAPVDVTRLVPGIAALARTAVRMHPMPGAPTVYDSSVGGPLLWPADEPWPHCTVGPGDHTFDGAPPSSAAFVPVLQIFARDVAHLPFPDGTDLMQLAWCPFDHNPYSSPLPALFWRDSATVRAAAAPPAPHPASPAQTVPRPCVVDPELVTEYPNWDLPPELRSAARAAFDGSEWNYHRHLSVAPGVKAGGYPAWCQLPEWPPSPSCRTVMSHVVTVPSYEVNHGEEQRWWSHDGGAVSVEGSESEDSLRHPTGLLLGDAGSVYVFMCTDCDDHPYDYVFQN